MQAAQARRNQDNQLFLCCFQPLRVGFMFFLLLCLCLRCVVASPMTQVHNPSIPRELVWNVNSSNIHVFLSKKPVLLTFYTPYCPHCQHFEQPLQRIAAVLAKDRFTVGRCDVSIQKALGARFNVHGVPAIFLYRDGKMWNYYGPLVAESVIDFSTNLYKKEKAIDYLNSPVGPIGISRCNFILIRHLLSLYRSLLLVSTHSLSYVCTHLSSTSYCRTFCLLFHPLTN